MGERACKEREVVRAFFASPIPTPFTPATQARLYFDVVDVVDFDFRGDGDFAWI